MKRKVLRALIKSLPVVASLAIGAGATVAVVNRGKVMDNLWRMEHVLEDRAYDKLLTRQIIQEEIPLQ